MQEAPKDSGEDLSKGLAVLTEVWNFSNRVAALQKQYAGKAIPIDKLFGAMFGIADKPNPLEFVEKQLAQIDAKLDRVLAGIEELKIGQMAQSVLAAYLDMSDPVYLIDKYFQDLAAYDDSGAVWTDAERKIFVDKLLGTVSDRDSVAFCAHKIVKLSPVTGAPLFLELLFPYLSAGATAANARQIYLKGAFAFRSFAEVLSKALVLETFAATALGGDPDKLANRAQKVTAKYQGWIRASSENCFLPFVEGLATCNFKDEYLGCHDNSINAHKPFDFWRPAPQPMLQSADALVAKLLGKKKSVTLRVIPNVPPIADKVPADPGQGTSAGDYTWEIDKRPQTTLTRANLLGELEATRKNFFNVFEMSAGKKSSKTIATAESVGRFEGSFVDGAAVPPGFDRKHLSFLRYRFDLSALSDDAAGFNFGYDARGTKFQELTATWSRWYTEEKLRQKLETFAQIYPFAEADMPDLFKLPSAGQLSPVLLTYGYAHFGQQ